MGIANIGQSILGAMTGDGGLLGKGLDLISKRVKDKDLAEQLSHDFSVLVEAQGHELATLTIASEQDFERELTKRIEVDAKSSNKLTVETRPVLARRSWTLGSVYIGANLLSTVISPYLTIERFDAELGRLVIEAGPIIGLDFMILTVILSPALQYIGVRSFDKWSAKKFAAGPA